MINKDNIVRLVENELKDSAYFLVDVEVNAKNVINVFVDGDAGIPISQCVKISRIIEKRFDRDEEDYELRVSSPGLDKAFTLLRQYKKYLGKSIRVITREDEKFEGKLVQVNESDLTMEIAKGKKKKNKEIIILDLPFEEIKEGKPVISFK